MGNLCCAKENSVQFFVQFFTQLNCTVYLGCIALLIPMLPVEFPLAVIYIWRREVNVFCIGKTACHVIDHCAWSRLKLILRSPV